MIASRARRCALAAVAVVLALGTGACSSSTSDAATITYRDATGSHTIHITRGAFTRELADLVGSAQFEAWLKERGFPANPGDPKVTTSTDIAANLLGQLVDQSAADALFSALHLSMPPSLAAATNTEKADFAFQDELGQDASGATVLVGSGKVFSSFPAGLQRTLVERQARATAVDQYWASPTPDKVRALYDQFAGQICPSGRIVSHILVKSAAVAGSILAQLRAGASFATLARAHSTDTGSAGSGGTLGCLARNTYVKPFEEAAYAAPFGTPVGPVHSQFGYHVILVRHPAFTDFAVAIAQALQQNAGVVRLLELQSMHVWINPIYGTGALVQDPQSNTLQFRVTPPPAPALRGRREKSPATTVPATTTTTAAPGGG